MKLIGNFVAQLKDTWEYYNIVKTQVEQFQETQLLLYGIDLQVCITKIMYKNKIYILAEGQENFNQAELVDDVHTSTKLKDNNNEIQT